MKESSTIAVLGSVIGDPARANMLCALMAGRAMTAGELAREAGVSAPTASSHLAKLVDARFLIAEISGRHRYYRLAGYEVAEAVEAIASLAQRIGRTGAQHGPKDSALRQARCCYDHLAGQLGTELFDALSELGCIAIAVDGITLTPLGRAWFENLGLDIAGLAAKARPLCRVCLDWTERRHHLAGSLGAALLDFFFARGWARRDANSRAIHFSPGGLRSFKALLEPSSSANAPQEASLPEPRARHPG